MRAEKVALLLSRYETCQKCQNRAIGNGEGKLVIEDYYFFRSCKCGWFIKVNENGLDIRERISLKFYEFNDYEYYALIGAVTKEKAIEEYKRCISSDESENCLEPDEISKDEAIGTILESHKENTPVSKEMVIELIKSDLIAWYAYIFLVDSDLI